MYSSYLLTGATGFLGKYIDEVLVAAGNKIIRVGKSASSNIICNLALEQPVLTQINAQVVIHAAGKAHIVPKTEAEAKDFLTVNLTGTINLCKALAACPVKPKAFVFISTVAVYGVTAGENIDEQYPLNGTTPYAQSKIQAEAYLKNWCLQHGIMLTILRLPLVAGVHPPGNLGAMIKGIKTGKYFNVGGGVAKKSVVMAKDVATWIPVIAQVGGTYNLTDGQHPSFASLALLISKQLGKTSPKNIPGWLAHTIAMAGNLLGSKAPINTETLQKITGTLTYNDNHARKAFGWKPQPVLQAFTIT